jgi:cytochrome c-type biogenesis protein CcmE
VTYSGSQPQGFKEGQKVVAIGELTSPHHMNATQLLVNCPSKYE